MSPEFKVINHFIKKLNRIKSLHQTSVILWDFDGTLYRNKEVGIELEKAYLNFLHQHSPAKIPLDQFRSDSYKLGSWSKTVAHYTNKSERFLMDQIETQFNKHHYIKPDPKIVELISQLPQYRHIVFSNSKRKDVVLGLAKLGFKRNKGINFSNFEKIFGRDNLDDKKPSLVAFKQVVNYTKRPIQEHLMIGDSLYHDILPAQKIGMKTILVKDFI